jgi:methyl-accepting chemotaxis protein
VAREIGDKGDLDQEISVVGPDEIGTLSQTLRNMVIYFREMSAVSDGDISVEVKPRSSRDTLNIAFSQMTKGLRTLVRSVRARGSVPVRYRASESRFGDRAERDWHIC